MSIVFGERFPQSGIPQELPSFINITFSHLRLAFCEVQLPIFFEKVLKSFLVVHSQKHNIPHNSVTAHLRKQPSFALDPSGVSQEGQRHCVIPKENCVLLKPVYSLIGPYMLKIILNTLKKSPPFHQVNANINVYVHPLFDYQD